MKIKNSEINVLSSALVELASVKTGFKIGYAAVKSIRKLEGAAKDYEKARISIVEKYAQKGENGVPKVEDKQYVFETPEIKEVVEKEVAGLNDMEIEVEIHSLPSKDFELVADITPALIYRLGKFIEE